MQDSQSTNETCGTIDKDSTEPTTTTTKHITGDLMSN